MAGIYIHIPFCKTACYYCDFYKSTNLTCRKNMVKAITRELELRKNYLRDSLIETVYIGGGTPSLLTATEVGEIVTAVRMHFQFAAEVEFTFEANPDDLNFSNLKILKSLGVNRLSIGVQSFNDKELSMLNRRHTAQQAVDGVEIAQKAGFNNISLDVIYGLPGSDCESLAATLKTALSLHPQHISAYHLTIERGTVLHRFRENKKIEEIKEAESIKQYFLLLEELRKEGFKQYEVSSFSKAGKVSRHNMHYWKQKKYLGIGPSAHSYDLTHRQWNVSDNEVYMDSMKKREPVCEKEELSLADNFNDYVMLGLRTTWGIDLNYIRKHFGKSYYKWCKSVIVNHAKDFLSTPGDNAVLTAEALFRSDSIISEFFIV